MNILSKAQWSMLHRAAQDPVSINENLNTITALFVRDLIKFTGKLPNKTVSPTKFGIEHIRVEYTLKGMPKFNSMRKTIKSYRR